MKRVSCGPWSDHPPPGTAGETHMNHRRIGDRLVVATHNPGKLKEMRELLAPYGVHALSARELGVAEPAETGASFHDNARIKAQAAAAATTLRAFADGSGLVGGAFDGAGGINSVRWAAAV